jgi:hypothetical protein
MTYLQKVCVLLLFGHENDWERALRPAQIVHRHGVTSASVRAACVDANVLVLGDLVEGAMQSALERLGPKLCSRCE